MNPYYQDNLITIYHGDCREILPQLPDNSVDLVLTDPPYFLPNTQFRPGMRLESRMWSNFSFAQVAIEEYLKAIVAKTCPDMEFYFCLDELSYAVVYPIFYRTFYNTKMIVWDKGNIGLGGKWRRQFELILYAYLGKPSSNGQHPDIIKCKRVENPVHPFEKPAELVLKILRLSDTDLILDPFLGSGTTAFCAKKLSRKCIGIEIEEKYCEIAANRCRQMVMELV